MRKHQFVKVKCDCFKRATNFKCKHCGTLEYKSARELRRLCKDAAQCDSPQAPQAPSAESFKGMLGGTFDCLAPDWETHSQDQTEGGARRADCKTC
jgi:hypothetical protein